MPIIENFISRLYNTLTSGLISQLDKNSEHQMNKVKPDNVFHYLFAPGAKDTGAKDSSLSTNLSVLSNIYSTLDSIKGKVIIQRENPDGKRDYAVFRNLQLFEDYLWETPPELRCFHECVFGALPQKLKFDIDMLVVGEPADTFNIIRRTIKGDDINIQRMLDNISSAIIDTFYLIYGVDLPRDNIIIMSSGGPTTSYYKYSFHYIIRGFAVKNNREAIEFTSVVLSMLDPVYKNYIDCGVNKQIQNFRFAYCAKPGTERYKSLLSPDNVEFYETVISDLTDCVILPEKLATDGPTKPDKATGALSADDISLIQEIAATYIKGQDLRYITSAGATSIISFQRRTPTHCALCNEIHHTDNTVMLTVSPSDKEPNLNQIFYKCRHNPGSIFAGEFYLTANSLDCTLDGNSALVNSTVKANIMQKIIDSKPAFPETLQLDCKSQNIYCESKLRPYENVSTLLIKANMKMGKTKALCEHISRSFVDTPLYSHKIIFVSFRQTFSSNIHEKFPNFTVYSDVKGPLKQNKLIVQVESLHRLLIQPGMQDIDLLILDESELILDQFDSGLLKEFNRSWATFKWLLANSKNVICMDAALSARTYNAIYNMRITAPNKFKEQREVFLHWNTYKSFHEDKYYLTANIAEWYVNLFQCIHAGQKVGIPISSLAEAEVLYETIKKRFPDKTVGIYSSKTTTSQKKKHFSDVATYWTVYDVLIYTPTVSAGISYEIKHFDKIFAYFTDQSCSVEVCIQMLYRIRDVSSHEYNICFKILGGAYPITNDAIKESLYQNRKNLFLNMKLADAGQLLEFEYAPDGNIKFHESAYFKLWLDNTRINNISKNLFIKRFVYYMQTFGAEIFVLKTNQDLIVDYILDYTAKNPTAQQPTAEPPTENTTANKQRLYDSTLLNVRSENRTIHDQLKKTQNENIIKAPELTSKEVAEIRDKFMNEQDMDQETISAYAKYKLRATYNFGGQIDMAFINKYRSGKVIRVFKNLKRILDVSDRLDNIPGEIKEAPQLHIARLIALNLKAIQEGEKLSYMHIMEQSDSISDSDVTKKYVYDQHRIALFLLKVCGLEHMFDTKYISQDRLYDAFAKYENALYKEIMTICPAFGIRPPQVVTFKSLQNDRVSFVNGIITAINKVLGAMYGVRLRRATNDTTLFQLAANTMFAYEILNANTLDTKPNVYSLYSGPGQRLNHSAPEERT